MVSWEYEYIRHNLHKAFIDELNKAGVNGWELVTVEKDAQHYYMGFMKRQVLPADEPTRQEAGIKTISDDLETAREAASRRAAFNRIINQDK